MLPPTTALASVADPVAEHFVGLVVEQVRVPVSLVTLVAAGGQVFPGALGLPEPWQTTRRTPLSHSFCQHVVLAGAPLVVPDSRRDPVLRDNPAIVDLGVAAYAGVPLTDAVGDVVGSLCAIDTAPRHWTDQDVSVLERLAEACSAALQLVPVPRSPSAADLVPTRQDWSGSRTPDRRATVGRAASWSLHAPRELTLLRRALRARLAEVEGPDDPDGAALRVLSAVEELASNGLRHGRAPVELTVTRSPVGWLVAVTDAATDVVPRPAVGRDPALGGLGLVMIDQLCDDHGWYVDAAGKHVWGLVAAPPR